MRFLYFAFISYCLFAVACNSADTVFPREETITQEKILYTI